jgi:hypothetical protein
VIPETRGVDSYKDITTRMGAVYDLTGAGRTVLKMSLGSISKAPASAAVTRTRTRRCDAADDIDVRHGGVTRAWTDANRNFVPDCDLSNPLAQDLRASGGDLCGVAIEHELREERPDEQLRSEVAERVGHPAVGLEPERLVPAADGLRSALDVTYSRRWFHGFSVVDNLALQPGDLTPFTLTARSIRACRRRRLRHPRLYDVVPEKAAGRQSRDRRGKYGQWRQYYNGLDVTVDIRVGSSFTLIGGTSTGQTVADSCDVRARLPELSTATTGTSVFGAGLANSAVTPVSPYCHVGYGVLTQFGACRLHRAEGRCSAVGDVPEQAGAMLAANYAAPIPPSRRRSAGISRAVLRT